MPWEVQLNDAWTKSHSAAVLVTMLIATTSLSQFFRASLALAADRFGWRAACVGVALTQGLAGLCGQAMVQPPLSVVMQ